MLCAHCISDCHKFEESDMKSRGPSGCSTWLSHCSGSCVSERTCRLADHEATFQLHTYPSTHPPTYLSTYLPTYLPPCLRTYLPIPTNLPTDLPTSRVEPSLRARFGNWVTPCALSWTLGHPGPSWALPCAFHWALVGPCGDRALWGSGPWWDPV